MPLHAPALRERDDDVILIARAWLARAVIERPAGRAKDVTLTFSDDAEDAELIKELQADSPFSHAEDAPLVQGAPAAGDGPRAGQRVTLEELEKTHIRRLLDELHNVSEVSRIVGIDRRTLQRKMIAWGFRDPKPSDSGEG